MITTWGERVSSDATWPEYPRPQLVRDDWINLNGLWQYAIAPKRAAMPARWDGEIRVPFCVESHLSGVERRVADDERLWYRRAFHLAAADARTLLYFGAVDYSATVFINGAFVTSHVGGFDPFTVDITDYIDAGNNELVVAVDDPTSATDQPRGKQHLKPQGIWYTPVTGIWQTVWLEQVPRDNHIAEVRVTPDLADESIEVEVLLGRPTRDSAIAIRLTVRLEDQAIVEMIAPAERTLRIPIPSPARWSPQTPTLYDLDVELVRVRNPLPAANEQQAAASLMRQVPLRGATEAALYASNAAVESVLDSARSYFGMRSIAVRPHAQTHQPTLLLNGEPVFHLATLDQGWWPDGLYTPPADEAIVYEIEFLKSAGFNAVRKHIKVEPARYYYHCDRLGLLVWKDMPSGFLPAQFVAPNDEGEALRSSVSTEAYELELQRMINRLRNHPSIVVWVLHNEGWGQFDSARLCARVKSLDPTRPVNAVSGWRGVSAGDLIDRHDYDPEPTSPKEDGVRAIVIGEYGGIGWPIAAHLWNPDMRNWGYQTFHSQKALMQAYARTTAAIVRAHREHGVCAAVYTQTTDVEGEVNGLLTYDRRVEKLPRNWLAAMHASLV